MLLIGRLWVGSGSFVEIWHMKEQIKIKTAINEEKREKNRMFEAEIEAFKRGREAGADRKLKAAANEAVIERARSEFGMIKRGETFYQVILKPEELESATNEQGAKQYE